MHIDDVDDPLPAKSVAVSPHGSPRQRIRDLQALTDQALAEADQIVTGRIDESVILTQAARRRMDDSCGEWTTRVTVHMKKGLALPVCMHMGRS